MSRQRRQERGRKAREETSQNEPTLTVGDTDFMMELLLDLSSGRTPFGKDLKCGLDLRTKMRLLIQRLLILYLLDSSRLDSPGWDDNPCPRWSSVCSIYGSSSEEELDRLAELPLVNVELDIIFTDIDDSQFRELLWLLEKDIEILRLPSIHIWGRKFASIVPYLLIRDAPMPQYMFVSSLVLSVLIALAQLSFSFDFRPEYGHVYKGPVKHFLPVAMFVVTHIVCADIESLYPDASLGKLYVLLRLLDVVFQYKYHQSPLDDYLERARELNQLYMRIIANGWSNSNQAGKKPPGPHPTGSAQRGRRRKLPPSQVRAAAEAAATAAAAAAAEASAATAAANATVAISAPTAAASAARAASAAAAVAAAAACAAVEAADGAEANQNWVIAIWAKICLEIDKLGLADGQKNCAKRLLQNGLSKFVKQRLQEKMSEASGSGLKKEICMLLNSTVEGEGYIGLFRELNVTQPATPSRYPQILKLHPYASPDKKAAIKLG